MTCINAADIVSQAGAPLSVYTELLTFTPIIIGGSSAGTGIYSTQSGFYHKIGNIVFITGSIIWSAHTGTGDMLFGNFPFSIRNLSEYDPECAVRTESIPWPAGSTMAFGELQAGKTYGVINGIRTNGTAQTVQMNGSGTIHFTGFYLT